MDGPRLRLELAVLRTLGAARGSLIEAAILRVVRESLAAAARAVDGEEKSTVSCRERVTDRDVDEL